MPFLQSCNKLSGGIFVSRYFFRSGKPSSKLRVPFIPDANVGTDDLSAQGRRGFCDMQRLIAVEGYGQIRMSSTLGNLPGIRVDAAGQVYSQHKGVALMQTAYYRRIDLISWPFTQFYLHPPPGE